VTETSPQGPAWIDTGRIPGLDAIRALSVTFVVLAHSWWFAPLSGIPRYVNTGALGVHVFFVISGFLITLLLLRERDRTAAISLKSFYARRALRIVPVYLALIGLQLGMEIAGRRYLPRIEWFGLLTYTTNFIQGKTAEIAHTWSLSLEEQFYLIWPIVLSISLTRAKRPERWLFGYLVVAPVLRVAASVLAHHWEALRGSSPIAAEPLVVGCLFAFTAYKHRDARVLGAIARWPRTVFVGALAGLCVSSFAAMKSPYYSLLASELVDGACGAALIWSAASAVGWFAKSLVNPVVVWIGTLSYGIYIWQQEVLGHIHVYWLTILTLLAVSAASYYLLERPFLQLKIRFSRGE